MILAQVGPLAGRDGGHPPDSGLSEWHRTGGDRKPQRFTQSLDAVFDSARLYARFAIRDIVRQPEPSPFGGTARANPPLTTARVCQLDELDATAIRIAR